ncbi:Cytochrome P450 4X1 [Cytospora mali]|uniref:Cytochrome P450 4X1 n=1 Tax=Cytospora mali TaxID=578113 RepID=A0A194W2Q7_CYTMA|nr:Cytochrome P450 4X1 [Valsa mali]
MVESSIPSQRFEVKQLLWDPAYGNENNRDFYLHIRRFSFSIIMTSTYGRRVERWDNEDVRYALESSKILGKISKAGTFIENELPLARLPKSLQPSRKRALEYAKPVLYAKMRLWNLMKAAVANDSAPPCFARELMASDYHSQGLTDEDAAWIAGELSTVIGDGRAPQYNDLTKLPYTRACVKEVLRLCPVPIWGWKRYTGNDVIYEDIVILKGTVILGNTSLIHYNPDQYEDPFRSKPERYFNHPKYSSKYAAVADPLERDHFTFENYRVASKTGLPIRIIPIDHTNTIWTLLDRKVLSLVRKLPGILGNNSFTRYNYRTWEIHDRYRSHHEMGDAFIMVTPWRNWLYVANPEIIMEIFRRRSDFPQCIELTEILNVFGRNLGTVEGQQWKIQRKMIASCFNEQNYEIVWSESLSLARDMLQYWSKRSSITTSADDLRTLSLHVLTGAGFGKHFKFEGHEERTDTNVSASYKNALQMILENCILIMGIGPKTLAIARPWLPKTWKLGVLAETCAEFQRYMTELYEEEKHQQRAGPTFGSARTLMNSLVRASQDEAKAGGGLTESEIYGNMFMLNFTGHDTTAHTFTFAIHFLAAHPDVQDWVSEEVRSVHNDNQDEWNYVTDFPRLSRCLAVMLETLRLYTPIPVAKWTATGTPTLKIGDKITVLPPDTMVIPSYSAVHTEPETWGTDSLVWRPQRWIKTTAKPGEEELITPRKGSFLGWSEGARDCPARKFSQVEFVAAMATLLRDWRVDPVALDAGESLDEARKRVLNLIETDFGAVLLLQMLHPERASLTWTKRLA